MRKCPACGQTFYGSVEYLKHVRAAHSARITDNSTASPEPIRSRMGPTEISEYQRYPAAGVTQAVRDALAKGPLTLDGLVTKVGKSRASVMTGLNRLVRQGLLVRTPLYGKGHEGRSGMQKKIYRLKR